MQGGFNVAVAARTFAKNVKAATRARRDAQSQRTRGLLNNPSGSKVGQRRGEDSGAMGSMNSTTVGMFGGERSGATIRAIYREVREMIAHGKVAVRLPPKGNQLKGQLSIKNVFHAVRKATYAVLERKRIAALFLDILDESHLRRTLAGHIDKQIMYKITHGTSDLVEFRQVERMVDIMSRRPELEKYPALRNMLANIVTKFGVLKNLTLQAEEGMAKMRKMFEDRDMGVVVPTAQLEEQLGKLQDLAEEFSEGLDELRRQLVKFGVSDSTLDLWKPLFGLTSETCWFHTLVNKPVQPLRKKRSNVFKYQTAVCENLIKDFLNDSDKFAERQEIVFRRRSSQYHQGSFQRRSTSEKRGSVESSKRGSRGSMRLSITEIGKLDEPIGSRGSIRLSITDQPSVKPSTAFSTQRRKAVVKFQDAEDFPRKGMFQGLVKQKVLKAGPNNVLNQLERAQQGPDLSSAIIARKSLVNAPRPSVVGSSRKLYQHENSDAPPPRHSTTEGLEDDDAGDYSESSSSTDWIAEVVGRESQRLARKKEKRIKKGGDHRASLNSEGRRNSKESITSPPQSRTGSKQPPRRSKDDTQPDLYAGEEGSVNGSDRMSSCSRGSIHTDRSNKSESSEDDAFHPPAGWDPIVAKDESTPEQSIESASSKLARFKDMLCQMKGRNSKLKTISCQSTTTVNTQFFRTGGFREPGLGPRYLTNATTVDDVVMSRREIQEHISGEAENEHQGASVSNSRSPEVPTDLMCDVPRPQWDSKNLKYTPVSDIGKLNWMTLASGAAASTGRKFKSWLMEDVKTRSWHNVQGIPNLAEEDDSSLDKETPRVLYKDTFNRYAFKMASTSESFAQEMTPRGKQVLHVVCEKGDNFPRKLQREPMSHSVAIWGQEESTMKCSKHKSTTDKNSTSFNTKEDIKIVEALTSSSTIAE